MSKKYELQKNLSEDKKILMNQIEFSKLYLLRIIFIKNTF